MMGDPSRILSIQDLRVSFRSGSSSAAAVEGVSYDVFAGETLGVVGESGCGKSVTALSILRLIPSPPGQIDSGTIEFDGRDLLGLKDRALYQVRGGRNRDDLPGAHDLAQSGALHRPPAYRGPWCFTSA